MELYVATNNQPTSAYLHDETFTKPKARQLIWSSCMSGRVVTFNTQMHADKQAGWLKRRKGSFLMMLAPIHCPKSPKSSKLKVWKATKLTKTGRSKSTKAGTTRTWRTRGETTQNRVERTRVCSAEPSANATNLQQRMSDTCSSADRLCSVLETGWYIMGLQRLSKDYDIVFSSRQLMFSHIWEFKTRYSRVC